MPLTIEMLEAAPILKEDYNVHLIEGAEATFEFPATLGDFTTTGVVTTDEPTSVIDGDPVVRTYTNMTIQSGHIFRPSNRCKGLFLYILGNLVVNGQLTMTARGANVPGKYVGMDYNNNTIYFNNTDIFSEHDIPVIAPAGGGITAYPAHSSRVNGNPGINGACGGGGSGGKWTSGGGSGNAGRGQAGTSFSGGAGGGALNVYARANNAQDGAINGGKGGNGLANDTDSGTYGRTAGGGAGNPGGTHGKYLSSGTGGSSGGNGTGGLIILFVKGTITIGPSGIISADGVAGGNATAGSQRIGGGGSGGGAIHIFHKGTYTKFGTIRADGGAGGTGYATPGGNGGNGTINIVQI